MAEKTLLLVMRVKVEDMPSDERKRIAKEDGISQREMPRLADADAADLADLIGTAMPTDAMADCLWPGSNLYLQIADAQVLSATWDR